MLPEGGVGADACTCTNAGNDAYTCAVADVALCTVTLETQYRLVGAIARSIQRICSCGDMQVGATTGDNGGGGGGGLGSSFQAAAGLYGANRALGESEDGT